MKKLEETIEQIEQLLSKLFSYRLFWILSIIVVVIILFLVCYFWVFAPDFLNLTDEQRQARELHSGLIRNRAWILWMLASFTGLTIGLWLTNRGRKTQEKQWQTQHKVHLHDRLEKATTMLGNQTISMRITGCRLLRNLAIDEESMKSQCVHLLFSYINNPYLKPDGQDKDPNNLFPINKPLRPDIQESIESFTAIYNHYGDEVLYDDNPVELPIYFWKNMLKDIISIRKTNLSYSENLQNAHLVLANLHGVNLQESNLQGADLQRAKLDSANLQGAFFSGADLSFASLQGANLQAACLGMSKLQGANLNGANLNRAHCVATNLHMAFLIEVDLSDANLQRANLDKADLKGANMQRADLREANFNDADLHEANLIGANIASADMSYAKNLTKEQVLSTNWKLEKFIGIKPPSLPEELKHDPDVQEWLATSHYDNEKKTS